jgi:hypothetical protein
MMLTALLAAWLAAPAPPAASPAVLAGEAIKVDLGRRQLVVRTLSPPRENVFQVDPVRTQIAAGGRAIALDAIRPGEWVLVASVPGTPRLAVFVKAGAARPAARRRE